MAILGNIIIIFGLILMAIGILGVLFYKDFCKKALVASLIDSAGLIAFIIGIICKIGVNVLSLKVIFILFIIILVNPVTTHKIMRSYYKSGHEVRK